MANHTLDNVTIYDGSYLATGLVINTSDLRMLATALCDDTSYHDLVYHAQTSLVLNNEAFDRQVESNGGYCNKCAEHAAFILSRFNISERGGAA